MANNSFLDEALAKTAEKVSLVILNQKQVKDSIAYALNELLEEDATIVFVSLTRTAEAVLKDVKAKKNNLYIIDAFSNEGDQDEKNEKIIYADTPSNLTGIQIGIEKAQHASDDKNIIIFDSLGVLSVYNDKKMFGKFLYLFSNKARLDKNTCLFFTTKDSIEENALESAKQFFDKVFDYSALYTASAE